MNYPDTLRQLDTWFADGVERAGPDVVLCRRGCIACCNGPFDISPADARLVAGAVARLDPETQTTVRSRARTQVATYADVAPAWHAPWDIDALGDERFDEVSERLAALPCPALGDDGGCLVYTDRPATCRIIGLPMITVEGGVLENACPIRHTSARYEALEPTPFDLALFESVVDDNDAEARTEGWVSTTVAGAILYR
ncbi:MAG: YkgJ family cysteine cluster protein [Gemmatimonadales bacterium]